MSRADYEICPGCDGKALYVDEVDVPATVEVWHRACREKAAREALDAERERIAAAVPDAIRKALGDLELLWCSRAWEAWGVGTMTADDFSPAAEDDDIVSQLADAVAAIVRGET